ncbi:MAG: hypothetical protein ACREBG_02595 [Pyrinomonadaceae bacterium]
MTRGILLIILQLFSWTVFGQNRSLNQKKTQFVEVPREQVLIVVVNQPNSPLKIEEAACLLRIDKGKRSIRYRVRNASSKPIATFTVISWTFKGAGGTLPVLQWGTAPLMPPGGVLDSMKDEHNYEILPLTDKFRDQLKQDSKTFFEGKMVEIYFLLVDQVLFADGSVYKDQAVSDALSEFLTHNDSGLSP